MTNFEVARAMVGNASAYAEDSDMQTVICNLQYIQKLLNDPKSENPDYDCESFK